MLKTRTAEIGTLGIRIYFGFRISDFGFPPREIVMRTKQRKGFTLVELMVAMALTIFVMVILTQAFVVSIDLFSGLKGIGDMQENLRAGTNTMRFDLGQNHFEGMRRTSDPGFSAPREGFLRVYQQAISTAEGVDADGMPSSRANPTLGNA